MKREEIIFEKKHAKSNHEEKKMKGHIVAVHEVNKPSGPSQGLQGSNATMYLMYLMNSTSLL